jgi:hypothetical protein
MQRARNRRWRTIGRTNTPNCVCGDTLVTREGVDAGHGIDVSLGQAHESAAKEAESDARKGL